MGSSGVPFRWICCHPSQLSGKEEEDEDEDDEEEEE